MMAGSRAAIWRMPRKRSGGGLLVGVEGFVQLGAAQVGPADGAGAGAGRAVGAGSGEDGGRVHGFGLAGGAKRFRA